MEIRQGRESAVKVSYVTFAERFLCALVEALLLVGPMCDSTLSISSNGSAPPPALQGRRHSTSSAGPQFMALQEAVQRFVLPGCTVALEGFTHLIPFAAGHEIIRQGIKNLTLVRMTPDLIYDQLIGAGCAKKLIFSWGGNPGVGSLHRLRDAIEQEYPAPLEVEEHTHAGMAAAYQAGAANLPFAVLRGYVGVDLPSVNHNIRSVRCPYTGELLATVPALRPDVAVIHAQRADRSGNILIEGIVGIQKECAFASLKTLVTVEEVVEDLNPGSVNSVVLPAWTISAVSVVPMGAYPSYARGYYNRSNAFYIEWDSISSDRNKFHNWLQKNVLERPVCDHD